jgi:hypothetical protein
MITSACALANNIASVPKMATDDEKYIFDKPEDEIL